MILFLEKFRNNKTKKELKELHSYILSFFEDLQNTNKCVDLPPLIKTKNLMQKFKLDVAHPKEVSFYYKKLQEYKQQYT